jgi:hypothetical protein
MSSAPPHWDAERMREHARGMGEGGGAEDIA